MKIATLPMALGFCFVTSIVGQTQPSRQEPAQATETTCREILKNNQYLGKQIAVFGVFETFAIRALNGKAQAIYEYKCRTREGKDDGGVRVLFIEESQAVVTKNADGTTTIGSERITKTHSPAAEIKNLRDPQLKSRLVHITGVVVDDLHLVSGEKPVGRTVLLSKAAVDLAAPVNGETRVP